MRTCTHSSSVSLQYANFFLNFFFSWFPIYFIEWANGKLGRYIIENIYIYHALLCCAESLQLYLTLCNPVYYTPPASSVHGILQAWILEWVAMPFSRESSQLRDWTRVSYIYYIRQADSLPLVPPGKPKYMCAAAKLLSRFSRVQLCATP